MTFDHHKLLDFVAWVKFRRHQKQFTQIDDETLEYVAQGVERFLDGKPPWPKQRGNKPKRALMWECFYLTFFGTGGKPPLPQHIEEGGAYAVVGGQLGLSPSAVAKHARNARKIYETPEGKEEFLRFLAYEYGWFHAQLIPADHPMAIAEREKMGYKPRGKKL
jgi:hypothetical protein